jgi:preprotein translocase subunit YajC
MAPPPAGTQANPTGEMLKMVGMMAIFGVMMYLVMIRPQQKKAKEHARLLSSLKSGDEVVTGSGIVGTIITVKERTVTLRTADSKLELLKSAITDIANGGANSKS